ncbi:MAG: pyrroloquinoline quinone-dependent dehydrogenase, partial [Gammaproteobacteria bacterium]|nr:pyrroloquinoline quinone-dependent dehydrogenase [Gammaproteobacteria bacterium]
MQKALLPVIVTIVIGCSSESPQQNNALNENWDTYLGDPGRSHYSPLTEITRDNVSQLELAWSYDSGEIREGSSTMYTSPLIVDGVLYGLSPKLVAFALNAATGEELWRYDYGGPGASQRGL